MLMSHKSIAKLVLNEDTLQEVLGVLQTQKNAAVLSSCIGVIEKMTKDPDMSALLSEVRRAAALSACIRSLSVPTTLTATTTTTTGHCDAPSESSGLPLRAGPYRRRG